MRVRFYIRRRLRLILVGTDCPCQASGFTPLQIIHNSSAGTTPNYYTTHHYAYAIDNCNNYGQCIVDILRLPHNTNQIQVFRRQSIWSRIRTNLDSRKLSVYPTFDVVI